MRRLSGLVIISILFAAACTSNQPAGNISGDNTTGNTSAAGVRFSAQIQPIFDQNCVVCHQGPISTAPGGMSLASGSSYVNLVNVKSGESPLNRVQPGSPDQSYIIAKLTGNQSAVGGSGQRMPFNQPPLPQQQISLIQQWIAEGAPNN